MADRIQVKAGGNINPSRFVAGGAADYTVIQGGDAAINIIGVSQEGTKATPVPEVTNVLAAEDGDSLQIYPYGSECVVEVGTGGATRFTYMASDADGKAVAAASGEYAFFMPYESAVAGEKVRGLVLNPVVLP